MGVDIDIHHVIDVIDEGHDVVQADMDRGLAMLPDGSYDCAILGDTLQVLRKPRDVFREMLRVAREGIVSFPNFGYIGCLGYLWRRGRMPKGPALPFEWYDTPNIHVFTLRDFLELCRQDGIDVVDVVCLASSRVGRLLLRCGLCNLGAERVVVKVSGEGGVLKAAVCRTLDGNGRPV
jgi:homoserine O-acetyltransferase